MACTRGDGPVAIDSADLIVAGEWKAEVAFCGDETFLAVPLEAGEELVTSVGGPSASPAGTVSPSQPRLTVTRDSDLTFHLGGCLEALGEGDPAAGSSGELEIVVVTAAGVPRRARIPLATSRSAGSWRTEVELDPADGAPVSLRLHAALPEGTTLWMRELRLSSETPLPGKATLPRPVGDRPTQILFLSVDTLREDALGALAPARDPAQDPGTDSPTPFLDRFVAQSQVFRPHYAAAGWTRPSHGTLLTGWSPIACGAVGTEKPLHAGIRTLAERFREAGFRTSALFYDIDWFHPRFDFDRGFEEYRVERWRLDRAVPEVLRWISAHRDQPFFFFFHNFEPHSDARWLPYESPGATRRTVAESLGDPDGTLADYGCREGSCASHLLLALDRGQLEPLPREREALELLYRRSASFVDRELGSLFDGLRRLGLFDDLLIVLTSDHGEMLLEDGKLLHGKPWEEVLRVPLAIKWPGGERAGERVATPTGAEDLAPTLLEAASLDAGDLPGRSLLGPRRRWPVFSGHNFRAVVYDGLKAVFRDPEPPLLFDLTTDPHEDRNLAEVRPEDLERLRGLVDAKWELDLELARRFEHPGDATTPGLTEEERQRLRSLGYLGSF